jgi:hypothetical protein
MVPTLQELTITLLIDHLRSRYINGHKYHVFRTFLVHPEPYGVFETLIDRAEDGAYLGDATPQYVRDINTQLRHMTNDRVYVQGNYTIRKRENVKLSHSMDI